MAKKSLSKQFGAFFLIFAVISVLVSGIITYLNQSVQYHNNCVAELKQHANYIANRISSEGDEFINLKKWYKEHPDDVEVPLDFRADLPKARYAFEDYIDKNYQGKAFGVDILFGDLDFEAQRLYVNYRFEYWFTLFFDVKESYGLDYVYFIYPEDEEKLTVNYMFDPTLYVKNTADGKEVLSLGDVVYEDPAKHKYMWEAWNNEKESSGIDSISNEYGAVYTYSKAVYVQGEKVGIICIDDSVKRITNETLTAVLRQTIISLIVLALGAVILFVFTNKMVIRRIIRLARQVGNYSEEKNPDIAGSIRNAIEQNDEFGTLSDKFADMIIELDEYMKNLQEVTAERERISAELNVATQIQADMLPRIFPPFPARPDFDLFASMNPAKEVGGDFYDFFLVDDDHIALVVADVSGKGVPAALFMVIAKTLIKNRVQMGESPTVALQHVNEQLCEGNEAEFFVTVWLAIIDLRNGHAVEANAGHENPAIYRKGGEYEFIKTKHSPAVAVMEGMKFRETEFDMQPGDVLFVYTDGVTEATNAENELFGETRLLEALNNNKDKEPVDLLPAVRKEIDGFVLDAPQFDDLTMLGFIYRGK